MLLEVNRPRHLIVGRPPIELANAERWRCLNRFKVVLLVEPEDRPEWEIRLSDVHFVRVLEYDASLAYELQANIRRALELVNGEPYNAIYVTFRPDDELQDAVNTRLGTIQVGGAVGDVMPDIFLRDFPGDLAQVGNQVGLRRLGLLAESLAVVADGVALGDAGQIVSQPRYFRRQPHIHDRDELADVEVIFLGRYFPVSDVRHEKHQLTRRILKAKECDPRGHILAQALGDALHKLALRNPTIDIITRVPPKQSRPNDHVRWLLRKGCRSADTKFGDNPSLESRFNLDVLCCARDYPPQKDARSYENRDDNVKGAFKCITDVRAKHVVIVDDILTSGSTMAECARQVLNAGARSVTALVLAKNQNVVHAFSLDLACDVVGCSGTLHPIFKNTDPYAMFWGCSKFREDGCSGGKRYYEGLALSNQLNTRDDLSLEEDIEF